MTLKSIPMSILICLGIFNLNCHSQGTGGGDAADRQPAVAGQFYSKDPEVLKKTIRTFFASAKARRDDPHLRAVIVPHAGYVFSGQVAASGINQIDPAKKFKRIFLIGSSHTMHFDAASVYAEGHFVTPLGKVPVDTATARALMAKKTVFKFLKEAHTAEHSLEVELPLLQVHLQEEFSIVPIVIGGQSVKTVQQIAEGLRPYWNDENLFVISTDFSHYPAQHDAVANDRRTLDAILQNSPDALSAVIKSNDALNIPGLSTSCCGWTSVLTLLYITAADTSSHYESLQYMNSGDADYGDTSRVVGYHAIAVYGAGTPAQESSISFSRDDQSRLLELARQTIVSYVGEGKRLNLSQENFSASLQQKCGAFVTLHKDGNLRGCIGRFTSDVPLYEVVCDMAIASATQDSRFTRVTKTEIPELTIEISVLTPMRKIASKDEIILGKHGIYITKGGRSGTFLPQVATETGWTLDEFLGHCAQDKAGIGWDGWKTAEIYVYEAIVFSE